jgi:hypothetical protein
VARRGATKRGARTTKGWARAVPSTREARRKLWARCGARAFLMPNRQDPGKSKFPVVSKGSRTCEPDCQGVRAAKARAMQMASTAAHAGYGRDASGYRAVARRAEALGRRVECRWA